MTTRRSPLESEIQRQIEAELGAEPDLILLRNTCGAAKYYADDGSMRMQKFGLGVGSPDLVGILMANVECIVNTGESRVRPISRTLGLWFCLEVKVPGEEADPHQEKCHEIWRRFGALVYVVHSVAEARAALEEARKVA